MRPLAGLVIAALACGNRPAPPDHTDLPDGAHAEIVGAGQADAAVAAALAPAPLGLADLAGYGWRKRGGQPAFRLARKAEAQGDWASVVARCRDAVAADPGHLEAAWLLAVGLARLGKLDEVVVPLQRAAAGDFTRWGQASLEQPALQAFLATPTGAAWRLRVDQDRARFRQALARAVIVTARGELYAVAPATPSESVARWYRLTHTGSVVGALAVPGAHKIAYVARVGAAGKRELAVGVIDLARGSSSRAVAVGGPGPLAVAFSPKPPSGFWAGSGAARAVAWRQLDDDFHWHALPAHTPRPGGPWLDVSARAAARLHALPADVVADWDEQSLASAIRIGSSNRVVSLASPGLIDGNSAAWSPDRVHVAFVAQLDDHCAPGAVNTAAFVADASTGGTRELERAAGGIALQWLGERALAIAGDRGVTIRSLDDGVPPIAIEGATGLMTPRERPRCAPVEPADAVAPADDAEPGGAPADDAVEPATEPGDAGRARP